MYRTLFFVLTLNTKVVIEKLVSLSAPVNGGMEYSIIEKIPALLVDSLIR